MHGMPACACMCEDPRCHHSRHPGCLAERPCNGVDLILQITPGSVGARASSDEIEQQTSSHRLHSPMSDMGRSSSRPSWLVT